MKISATGLILTANCLVMAVLAFSNPQCLLVPPRQVLLDSGANLGLLVLTGDWWRLITSQFLHVGALHLVLNMYALYNVAPDAERTFGKVGFATIYLFAGLAGALTSILLNPTLISSGASAAIFGTYAALVAKLIVCRREHSPTFVRHQAFIAVGVIVLSVIYGCFVPGIDNAAHLGGLFGGFAAGSLIALARTNNRSAISVAPVLCAILSVLAVGAWWHFEECGFRDYDRALKAAKRDQYQLAVAHLSRFLKKQPADVDGHMTRGLVYSKAGELPEALADFSAVITLRPKHSEAFNSRAWVECGLQKYSEAVDDATKSLSLNSKSAATYDTRGVAFAGLGEFAKALDDFQTAMRLNPEDPAAYFHRARLYAQMNQPPGSTQDTVKGSKYKPERWES